LQCYAICGIADERLTKSARAIAGWSAFIHGREVLEGHATIVAVGDGDTEEVVVAFRRVAIMVMVGIEDTGRSWDEGKRIVDVVVVS